MLPSAPYRQWTWSVPWQLRPVLARDRRLLSAVLTCFVRAVFRWQRAQARALGIVGAAPGAVTAIQGDECDSVPPCDVPRVCGRAA